MFKAEAKELRVGDFYHRRGLVHRLAEPWDGEGLLLAECGERHDRGEAVRVLSIEQYRSTMLCGGCFDGGKGVEDAGCEPAISAEAKPSKRKHHPHLPRGEDGKLSKIDRAILERFRAQIDPDGLGVGDAGPMGSISGRTFECCVCHEQCGDAGVGVRCFLVRSPTFGKDRRRSIVCANCSGIVGVTRGIIPGLVTRKKSKIEESTPPAVEPEPPAEEPTVESSEEPEEPGLDGVKKRIQNGQGAMCLYSDKDVWIEIRALGDEELRISMGDPATGLTVSGEYLLGDTSPYLAIWLEK